MATLCAALLFLVVACDEPLSAHETRPEPAPDVAAQSRLQRTTEVVPCEAVTPENTPKGATRLHFDRISIGMSPTICGGVAGPNDPLVFARYLQGRLRQEAGCDSCEISRIDLVTLLDVDLDLHGRWQSIGNSGHRRFLTYMTASFDPSSSADWQLEDAHFYFSRDGQGYEAFYDGLCPGSNHDPSVPGPRVVSEECMRFSERSAAGMQAPGLLGQEP